MNNMLKYTKMLLLFVLVLGLTSCDSEEETEYNLPGEWYTSEEIDFGAYTWGRGTIMTFNARNQGTIVVHMATRIICFSDGIGLVGLTI